MPTKFPRPFWSAAVLLILSCEGPPLSQSSLTNKLKCYRDDPVGQPIITIRLSATLPSEESEAQIRSPEGCRRI